MFIFSAVEAFYPFVNKLLLLNNMALRQKNRALRAQVVYVIPV
jgi:hypothetical protein